MSKNIVIKITKAGNRLNNFSISDDLGNILSPNISKAQLIQGFATTIEDSTTVIVITALDQGCCNKIFNIPVSSLYTDEIAAITYKPINTGSAWRHLTDTTLYNNFYGCINPYIIEYPFAYAYQDEIVQNIKDYSKVFKYFPSSQGVFNYNPKIQTNDDYFNKSIIYNDQQSSGILELVPKPKNDLSSYLKYPQYNPDSKTILFSKKDNFYQYNTFWDTVVDFTQPLFLTSCSNLSIDKVPNQDNLDYSPRSFKKYTIRGKDLRLRQILDNRSDMHIITQLLTSPSEISYN